MQVGDVVRLKSGGPAMTVEEVLTSCVSVAWVDEENGTYRDRFLEAMLLVEPTHAELVEMAAGAPD